MAEPLILFPSADRHQEFLAAYQAALRQWPAPYEERCISTSFGETHVVISGPPDAPPIVFLHALFATAVSWYPNAGGLAGRYRTFAVDILGEPNPSRPIRPMKTLAEMTQWFTELLDGLGLPQTFLVGNSFGAFLSATFAMRMPRRIRALTLIGPAATFKSMTPFYVHMFLPKMLLMLFPWLPGGARRVEDGLAWMRSGLPADPAWERVFLLSMLYGGMSNQVFPKVYHREELSALKTPTLLLVGDRERIYRPEDAVRIARETVPGLRSRIIPEAHHITGIANPTAVNQAIDDFFSARLERDLQPEIFPPDSKLALKPQRTSLN